MGVEFNALSVRVAASIQDTKTGTTSAITVATEDGQKRSSAQRSRDIMNARYWIWGIYRVVNKSMFFGTKAVTFTGTGVGYSDITALNITSVNDLVLEETTAYYGKPIPVFAGDDLQLYSDLLKSTKRYDIVAGLVGDHSQTKQTFRLKLILGSALANQNTASGYAFLLGYYANPLLTELTAASGAGDDLTESRAWHDHIERYAEYLGWKLSGNTDRANIALDQANQGVIAMVSTEYGEDAADRVRRHLQRAS